MRLAARALLTSIVLASGGHVALAGRVAAPAPAEPTIAVVSADDEAEKANPGRHRRHQPEPEAAPSLSENFRAAMDRAFGQGRWRQTSGYRTIAQENALRRAGAGTVPPGRLSKHSLGAPEAPGAYDAVVAGLSPAAAAARLKRAGGPFERVAAERAHGREGPHLHIELASQGAPAEN